MLLIVLAQAVLQQQILELAALRKLVTKLPDQRVVLLWQLQLKLYAKLLHHPKNSVQLLVPVPMQALALLLARRVLNSRSLEIRAWLMKIV